MKNNGKLLEKTIRLVQETLKNSLSTNIYSNYKIENESGNKRELDILIETTINEFSLRIAIECKDHKKPLEAKYIESFNSKCDRIKSINKKVFISRNGYQKDAIEAARYYNIDLLTAEKVSKETVISWLSIQQLRLKVIPEFTYVELILNLDKENIEKTIKNFNGYIYPRGVDKAYDLLNFIFDSFKSNSKKVNSLAIMEWLRIEEGKKFDPFEIHFKVSFQNYIIKNDKQKDVDLLEVNTGINVFYEKESLNIIDAREIKKDDKSEVAKSISLDIGSDKTADIILKGDSTNFYYTDENGQSLKLKHLFTYNPNKDSFEE